MLNFLARYHRRRLAAKHRARLAREGMAGYANINPKLIALHMREANWRRP
ncbi:MAG: hypothetical protein ACO32I_08610 [Candidatus Limnocylindrus sp.]